jgi:hypothetical protein
LRDLRAELEARRAAVESSESIEDSERVA